MLKPLREPERLVTAVVRAFTVAADAAGKDGKAAAAVERTLGTTAVAVERTLGTTAVAVERRLGTTAVAVERTLGTTPVAVERRLGTTAVAVERTLGTTAVAVERTMGTTPVAVKRTLGTADDKIGVAVWKKKACQYIRRVDKRILSTETASTAGWRTMMIELGTPPIVGKAPVFRA
jgi:hypothetical protein